MRLRYTLPALADLTSILDYITDRSPEFCSSAEADAPPPLGHWRIYPAALEMTFSERSFK
jgi:hypothetical protein